MPFLRKLASLLVHRGPDGEGFHRHGTVGLVHRRLSILDLEGGAQPIASADERSHIVANGEIYNYRELQNRIRSWGFRLRTDSDSEVPLYAWHRYGMEFVRHLEGMYAFAIYDETTEELVLARDPVGIKPLYVAESALGVAFASEAGALVRSGWVPAEVEERAWPDYFNKQYVDGSLTMFKGVRRVEPGEVIRIRRGEILERRTFQLELPPATRCREDEALEELDRRLAEVVESHLQSDVPYGAFLSGGIDSSCVVTKMEELVGRVRTYTVGFSSDTVHDERRLATALASRLDTEHVSVEFGQEDFWRYLPKMCTTMDDLMADYATLPTLKLAERAGRDVTVVLTGEGGDEGFAGYRRYRKHYPLGPRAWLRALLGREKPLGPAGNALGFGALFRDASVAGWSDREGRVVSDLEGLSRLQRSQALDIRTWLPHKLLTKVDRSLMAYGLEGRVPLLDREFLQFAFGLPDRLKIRDGSGKYLLRRWLADHAPEQDPWGSKRGFTVPIQDWLEGRRSEVRRYLTAHEGLGEVVDSSALATWLEHPIERRGAMILFNLLCYALWHDLYIGSAPMPEQLFGGSEVSQFQRVS